MTNHKSLPGNVRIYPFVFFVVILLGIENIYGRYFPNMFGLLGHDFSLANPALLEGAFWFWKNGILEVPWFTPSFCGGQPFFADPQSAYYSPLQWFTFIMPPTEASHAALLFALSIGYWSFYFLARNIFGLSLQASILAGSLAMLNGFIPYRFLIGEMGYQPFLATGFVALALLSPHHWRPCAQWKVGNVFWAGLAIAFMLQSGLTTLMIQAALGVLVVAIVARLCHRGVSMPVFLARGIAACVFAACLCLSKLMAGVTFMSHFPRESYALPGFPHLLDALMFPFYSLFLQSQTTWDMANPKLLNVQWAVFPHEWAYQFGTVYLLLLLSGLFFYIKNRFTGLPVVSDKKVRQHNHCYIFVSILVIVLILLLPVAVLWYTPEWNTLLKKIPIINTTSFPFRWIIIWIPLGCVVGALVWQSFEKKISAVNVSWLALVMLLVAMLLESTFADKSYYMDAGIQTYDPAPIDRSWQEGYEGHIKPIGQLVDVGMRRRFEHPNESLIVGATFLHCYNPVYGYRQETLPLGRLRPGPVLSEQDGYLNIKNPACLIWPEENSCVLLGDEFRATQKDIAKAFVERAPISFEVSKAQRVANKITFAAVIISGCLLLIFALEKIESIRRTFKNPG